jgi:hypothetical protein
VSRTGTARGARKGLFTLAIFPAILAILVRFSSSDACERVDEYECSEYMYPYLNIHNSTHSHPSEEEIAAKIAANIASVNVPVYTAFKGLFTCNFHCDF